MKANKPGAKKVVADNQVILHHPQAYVFSSMANRFSIDHDDGFSLIHFGLVGRDGKLIHMRTYVFPASTLVSQKENLVQFSDKIGEPKKKIPSWDPPAITKDRFDADFLSVVDFVHLTHWDDLHAEICFWNYSQGVVADSKKAGRAESATFGVAMIRCELDLQRAFLAALYEDE